MTNRTNLTPALRDMFLYNAPVESNPGYLQPGTRVAHPEDGMGAVLHTSLSRKVLVQLDSGEVRYYEPGTVQLTLVAGK